MIDVCTASSPRATLQQNFGRLRRTKRKAQDKLVKVILRVQIDSHRDTSSVKILGLNRSCSSPHATEVRARLASTTLYADAADENRGMRPSTSVG
jgi:hypothetical protein